MSLGEFTERFVQMIKEILVEEGADSRYLKSGGIMDGWEQVAEYHYFRSEGDSRKLLDERMLRSYACEEMERLAELLGEAEMS